MDKQVIIEKFQTLIEEKILLFKKKLDDLSESAKNETKSSAGDKYETGLAMLQIEQANFLGKLKESQDQLLAFRTIDFSVMRDKVRQGSLVKTNKGWFLVALALGKIVVGADTVFAISPQSPLGNRINGAGVGDEVSVNAVSYEVKEIV